MNGDTLPPAPDFDAAFQAKLAELLRWRRDVRRFRNDPVAPEILDRILAMACLAPSVGFSQPWRFVLVETPGRRRAVRDDFLRCNDEALAGYEGERAALYAKLKLDGLDEAPVHLAVFADEGTQSGHGLGRRTMPEMLRYSTVTAVHTLWLAARAWDIGVGWVSILDPVETKKILDVPDDWALVAYLCIGYPQEESTQPALLREGWQEIDDSGARLWRR